MSGSQPSTPREVYTTSNVALEVGRQVVQVRLDEARVGEAEVGRQLAGQADRGRREVGAGDRRPEPRPRQGVDAEVALQVEERPAVDVADRLDLVVAQPDATLAEAGQVVEVAVLVDRRPRLPERLVGGVRGGVLGVRAHPSDHTNTTSGARSAARQNATTCPARSRIQGFSSRGSGPSSSSSRSIQRPAMASMPVVGQPGHGVDPGRVHPLDGRARRPRRRARCGHR